MRLSIVIVTHNRCETLLTTLENLRANDTLPLDDMELLIVDNGSTDGTHLAAAKAWPGAKVIRRESNEGVSARNHAFAVARGKYVALIDDDSYPVHDALTRSMQYMDDHARCGAVVGRVVLRNDQWEASALPTVMINCAVCIRKTALDDVGGFPVEFFRQAEEYDLSFRLWKAGYSVERFEDLIYRHDKAPGNRAGAIVHRLDMRNNLILAERFFPPKMRQIYEHDWINRYTALAQHSDHLEAARGGIREAKLWKLREKLQGRNVLPPNVLEQIFGFNKQLEAVLIWSQRERLRNVAIADFSKNIFATYRACKKAGLNIVAITDNSPAFDGMVYRDVPILKDAACVLKNYDGIVLSNVSPAQVDRRMGQLNMWAQKPVLRLWHPQFLGDSSQKIQNSSMSKAPAA